MGFRSGLLEVTAQKRLRVFRRTPGTKQREVFFVGLRFWNASVYSTDSSCSRSATETVHCLSICVTAADVQIKSVVVI